MLRSISSKVSRIGALHHRIFSVALHSNPHVYRLNQRLTALGVPEFARNIHFTQTWNVHQHEDIDKSLLRLDQEIRRTGRVSRVEIDEILQDIRDMKNATSNQSLMILRCCGELVPSETPENRTKLVQEVWKTMENLNVPIDISHYNALLRVYLENEHKFNPTEFLQELSKKGVEPNRVTYQRLIARFCQDGDIDGASTILQHMKEKQLPINEHVFNALVDGHARAGDMESAEGIIVVMKQAGLEANDDTYVTLMCGYARKGDLSNIRRIVEECKDKDVHLIDRDFLNIIYTLCANGHQHLVEDILPMLKKHSGFNQDATNVILRLVNIGHMDVAYRILKEMSKVLKNNEVLPSGNFFLHQLVKAAPVEQIVKYCKIMMDEDINKFALSKACDLALQQKEFDKAFDLFAALKDSGAPIRQHYFWPFLAGARSEKDIFHCLKTMKQLDVFIANETLRDYVIPAIFKHSSDHSSEKTLQTLSNYTGISLGTIVPAALQHFLAEQKIADAIKFASKYRLQFSNASLRKSVVDNYFSSGNAKVFVQIVGSAGLDGDDNAREALGQMVLDILERSNKKAVAVAPILTEMLNHGIGLSNSGAELIQNSLGEELTPELANSISQLTSGDLSPKLGLYKFRAESGSSALGYYEDKSLAEIEAMYEAAVKAGNPTKSLRKALLFEYCRKKNFEKAEAIRNALTADGFVFSEGLQVVLLDLYSQCNKLEEAKAMYNSLKDKLDFPLDDIKILHYAGVLAAHEQTDECMEFLTTVKRDETRSPFGALQQAAAWKILNEFAEKGQIEQTQKVFKILGQRNLMHINNVTLGPTVKAFLVKDDLEGALNQFEQCAKEHHATPFKQELFCRLIKNEDAERLQKIIDLSTTLHGEVNTMYDLVFAFIQCGKLRQAKKILETPGLRARNDKIELTCQKYLEENRIGELENLIQVTKDILYIDRASMYFYLLQAYCKANDTEKALSVWTSLQEENIQPSSELLIFLADFLRKNNQPVPFVVPETQDDTAKDASKLSGNQQAPSLVKKFRQNIEANNVDAALQVKQRLESSSNQEKLSISDLSLLIEKMARAERLGEATRLTEEMLDHGSYPHPKTFRFLLGRLSSAADLDVLNRFETKLTPDLKRQTMFNTRLCIAYTNAGRGLEYFEKYIKQSVEKIGTGSTNESIPVPLAGATYILIRHEELLPKFEELATQAEQKGNLTLINSLWSFHMIKKNFNKAKELWNGKQLKSLPRFMFRSVLVEARNNQDEEIAKELLKYIEDSNSLSKTAKATAYSCAIDILCVKRKEDEALSLLTKSLNQIAITDYPVGQLETLKSALESKNKTFPHTIPSPSTVNRRRSKKNESSSSDSDSD